MPFQCGDAKSQTEKVRIWVNEIINVQIPSILQFLKDNFYQKFNSNLEVLEISREIAYAGK